MREMGPDGCGEAGLDIEAMSEQNERRFAAMELGAKEAAARVMDLEQQAARMLKEGTDARNAYQQQRAYIQTQLGEGTDAAKLHEYLKGMVGTMDAQFGITPAGDVAHGSHGYSPASSVGRGGGGRSRQPDGRRSGGGQGGLGGSDLGGESRRDRSPRLGPGREGEGGDGLGAR